MVIASYKTHCHTKKMFLIPVFVQVVIKISTTNYLHSHVPLYLGTRTLYNQPYMNNHSLVGIMWYALICVGPPNHYTFHKLISLLCTLISKNRIKAKCVSKQNVWWLFNMKRDQKFHSFYGRTKVSSNLFVPQRLLTPCSPIFSPTLLSSKHICG